MKRSIGVAPRFPGFTLALLVVLLLLSFAYSLASGASIISDRGVVAFVKMALYPALVAASLLATALVLMRIALSPVQPLLSLLILWAEVVLVVFLVFPLVAAATNWNGPMATLELKTPAAPIDTVVRSGDVAIVVGDQQGLSLTDVLVIDFTADPRITYHESALLDPRENTLVPDGGGTRYLGTAFFPAQESAALPVTIQRATTDINAFAERIVRHGPAWNGMPQPILVECAAATILLVSLWTLARMSQWLLLNWALVLVAVRAFFLVYHPALLAFAAKELPESLREFAPAAIMVMIAALLIVIAILMPPVTRWRMDVKDEE